MPVTIVTAAILVSHSGVAAQSTINLGRLSTCEGCRLALEKVVSLGSRSGDAIIEGTAVTVVSNSSSDLFGVFRVGTSEVLIFSESGTYQRRIGRSGAGPGEIEALVDAAFIGDELVTLDAGSSRLSRFSLSGDLRGDSRVDVRAGRFRAVSDTLIVIGSMDRHPESVGLPLHNVHLQTGRTLRHYGSARGEWNINRPFAQDVVLGSTLSPQVVWHGRRDALELEEWSVEGRRLRTVRGTLPWLPTIRSTDRIGPLPAHILHFGVDRQDRLWLLTRVPDQDAPEAERRGNEGYVLVDDLDDAFDARLDVIDLRKGSHVGWIRWDVSYAGLVPFDDEFAVQIVEYDEDVSLQVVLYRMPQPPDPEQEEERQ